MGAACLAHQKTASGRISATTSRTARATALLGRTICFSGFLPCPVDKRSPTGLLTQSWRRNAMLKTQAKYHLGQVLRHRKHPFRGVVFDVDAMFSNTEEWYDSIPEDSRPRRDQPFYHLLAENDQSYYVAYVSEQNLVPDETGQPVDHPDLPDLFGDFEDGRYPLQFQLN
jgi:heat shock protein HspQ